MSKAQAEQLDKRPNVTTRKIADEIGMFSAEGVYVNSTYNEYQFVTLETINHNNHHHYNSASPEEASARGACILETPEAFYENYPWGLIPKADANFVGRKEQLAALKAAFKTKAENSDMTVVIESQRRAHRQSSSTTGSASSAATQKTAQNIHGLGGVGKTQLAVEYVYQLMDEEEDQNQESAYQKVMPAKRRYALKVWLRGNTLAQDLRNLAAWLGLVFKPNTNSQQIAQAVYVRLLKLSDVQSPPKPRVLFIIDNGEWQDNLPELLPQPYSRYQHHFHWLITSREKNDWTRYFESTHFKICTLGVFSEEEALAYCKKAFSDAVKSNQADYTVKSLKTLSQQLGYLPLALAQAVAYINKRQSHGEGLESYLALLTQQGLHLHMHQEIDNYPRGLIATWLITLPSILAQSPLAVELLLACSYLAGSHISYGLLRAYIGDIEGKALDKKDEVETAIGYLLNYALLEDITLDREEPAVRIHPLVQEVLRSWMRGALLAKVSQTPVKEKISGLEGEVVSAGIVKADILSKVSTQLYKYSETQALTMEERARQAQLIPHLHAVVNEYKPTYSPAFNPLLLSSLLYRLGVIYDEKGDTLLAKAVYKKGLVLKEELHGPEHVEVAITLNSLGAIYGALGKYGKQEALLLRALSIKERVYSSEPEKMAIALVNLGNAYGNLGKYEKQLELLSQALIILERAHGSECVEVAKTLISLGNAYGSLGQYEQEKKLLLQALAIQERIYSSDHIEITIALSNLGTAYGSLGQYEKQKELLTRALTIQRQTYGFEHVEVARTLTNLGNFYGFLEQYEKQQEVLLQALTIKERAYGPDHVSVAITLNNLGPAYGFLKQYEKQQELLSRALIINEQAYGPDHIEVAITLMNLGNAYGDIEQHEEKKNLLLRALTIQEKTYGPKHVVVANTLFNLGIAYGSLGQYEEKKKLLKRALIIFEQTYGPGHGLVMKTLTSLGDSPEHREINP